MKKLLSLLAAAAAAITVSVTACAQAQHKVYDSAEVLSEKDEQALEKLAEKIVLDHGVDAVICTDRSLSKAPEERAKELFGILDAGAGDDLDGILLLIWFENDEQHFVTYKNGWAEQVFTGYADKRLNELVSQSVEDRDFTGASEQWLRVSGKFMKAQKKGKPYDGKRVYRTGQEVMRVFLLWLGIGAAVSAVICMAVTIKVPKRKRKLVRRVKFLPEKNSFEITSQRDILLYSNTQMIDNNSSKKKMLTDEE